MLNARARAFIGCLLVTREYGFDDLSVLTHAWHETGGFSHVVGQYNYWGIKTPEKSIWNGLTAIVTTHEYEPVSTGETQDDALIRVTKIYGNSKIEIVGCDGRFWKVRLPATFRDWPTCEQALLWYCDFIKRLYPNAFEKRGVPPSFFAGLVSGKYKYATDPQYVDKLTRLYMVIKNDTGIQAALQAIG